MDQPVPEKDDADLQQTTDISSESSNPTPKKNIVARTFTWPTGKNNKLVAAIFVVLFGGLGTYFLVQSFASPGIAQMHAEKPFVENAKKGLHWQGIKPAKAGGQCDKSGTYELVDSKGNSQGCTHGPDPAPDGVDITQDTKPLADAGTTGFSLAPKAEAATSCSDPGTDGNRVVLVYAHASDKPDRYATYASTFRALAAHTDAVYYASAQQTGGARHIRFATDASCNLIINRVTLSTTGDDNLGNTVNELHAKGYNAPSRKYLVFMDANVYCGIGQLFVDDKADQSNYNNGNPGVQAMVARVDNGCWRSTNPDAPTHELTHTLGAVQTTAPYHTSGLHCYDEYDVMCYDDGTHAMSYICPSTQEDRLDCNKNTYFNTKPASGSYLATHWNVARSVFLYGGGPVNNLPTGHFDYVRRTPGGVRVGGWAVDPDKPTAAINVDVYGGTGVAGSGNPGKRFLADDYRPDVGNKYPRYGDYHGFGGTMNLSSYGAQKFCAYGIDTTSGHSTLGCLSITLAANPIGALTSVTRVSGGVQITGWSFDPDVADPINVDVYGGTGATSSSPGKRSLADSPSVGTTPTGYTGYGSLHGFNIFLATGTNTQTFCAYGIDYPNTPGSNVKLGCKSA